MILRVFTQVVAVGKSPQLNVSIAVFLPYLVLAMAAKIIRIPFPPRPFIHKLPEMLALRRRTGLLRAIVFIRRKLTIAYFTSHRKKYNTQTDGCQDDREGLSLV